MLYRMLRATNQVYPLAAFWMYVLLFFIALGLIFIFPPGALLLLLLSMFSLLIVVPLRRLMVLVQRAMARSQLRHGRCPYSREPVAAVSADVDLAGAAWACAASGLLYRDNGEEVDLDRGYEPTDASQPA